MCVLQCFSDLRSVGTVVLLAILGSQSEICDNGYGFEASCVHCLLYILSQWTVWLCQGLLNQTDHPYFQPICSVLILRAYIAKESQYLTYYFKCRLITHLPTSPEILRGSPICLRSFVPLSSNGADTTCAV